MELVESLAALAHPQRLKIFRLLVRRCPDAVPSGEIAKALDVPANSCSVYLAALKQAGLIAAERHGTSVRYRVDRATVSQFNTALLGDCCRGRPDLCPDINPSHRQDTGVEAMARTFRVLFICTGNSARSIIAEAVLNAEGGGRFRGYSAGSSPKPEIDPRTLRLLSDKGIDITNLYPKELETFAVTDAPKMDFIFTLCDHAANEECPVWPGQPMSAHWGMADPTIADGTEAQKTLAFQQTYGLMRNRLRAFMALPVETLDKLSLQSEFDRIGRMSD